MVEHQLPKLAFAGSIPVSRSKQEFAVTESRLFLCCGARKPGSGDTAKKMRRVRSTGEFV